MLSEINFKIDHKSFGKNVRKLYKKYGLNKQFSYQNFYFIFINEKHSDFNFDMNLLKYNIDHIDITKLVCFKNNYKIGPSVDIITINNYKNKAYLSKSQLFFERVNSGFKESFEFYETLNKMVEIEDLFKKLDNELSCEKKDKKIISKV